jgi:hypothetical protein
VPTGHLRQISDPVPRQAKQNGSGEVICRPLAGACAFSHQFQSLPCLAAKPFLPIKRGNPARDCVKDFERMLMEGAESPVRKLYANDCFL